MRKLGERFNEALASRERNQYAPLTDEDRETVSFAVEEAAIDSLENHEGEDDGKFSIKADTKEGTIKTLIKNGRLDKSKKLPAQKYADKLFADFQWAAKNKSLVDKICNTAAELRSSTSIN